MTESVKVTFVSNYINHHQQPFCEALIHTKVCHFTFVQTQKMEQKRIDMGWGTNPADIPYVIEAYADLNSAYRAIMDSDILLIGWMEDESLVQDALREMLRSRGETGKHRLIMRISERLYREGQWRAISPAGLIHKYRDHIRYRRSPVYLLCNGAYVASDYSLIRAYPNRKLRFGYFPETRRYSALCELFGKKKKLKKIEIDHPEELPIPPSVITDCEIEIVWAGRLIPLKNPQYMIMLAEDLCKRGYRFHITIIGNGDLLEDLKKEAGDRMVEEYITFTGSKSPEEVRDIMECSHIHVFTSNHLEGWGAVVNEGMNAGCAEVVSGEAGAGIYLIDDGVSGLIYKDDSYTDMLNKILILFNDPDLIERYGRAAYDRIIGTWNAEVAAKRLIEFYEGYLKGHIELPTDGPFSEAPIIKPKFWAGGRLGE